MSSVLGRTRIPRPGVSSLLSTQTTRALSLSSPRPSPSPSPSPSSRPPTSLSPIYATHPPSTFADQDLDTFSGRQGNLWHNNVLDEQARLRRIDQLRIKLAPPGSARSRVLVSRGRIVSESEGSREGEEEAVWVEEDEKMVVWVDLPPPEGSENVEGEMGTKNRHSIILTSPSSLFDQAPPSSYPPWTPNPSLQPRPLPPHDPTNPNSILYNPRSTHSPFLPSTLSSSPSYPPLLLLANHLYKHLPSAPPSFPTLDLKFFKNLLDPSAPPTYEPTPLGKLDLSLPPVGRGAQPLLRMSSSKAQTKTGEGAVHPKRVELGEEGWEVVERLGRRFLLEGDERDGKERRAEEEVGERKNLAEWVEEVKRLQRVELESGGRQGTSGGVDASRSNSLAARLSPIPPPLPPLSPNLSSQLSAHPQDVRPTTSIFPVSKHERVPPTFTHLVVDPIAEDEDLSTSFASLTPSTYRPKPALSQARSTPRKFSPKPNPSSQLPSESFAILGSNILVPSSSILPFTINKPTLTSKSPAKLIQPHPPTQPKMKPSMARWKLDASSSPPTSSATSSTSIPAVTPNSTTPIPSTLASVSLHPHPQAKTNLKPKPTRRTHDASPSRLIPTLTPTPKPNPPSGVHSEEAASLYLSFLLPPLFSSSSSGDTSTNTRTRLEKIVRSKLSSHPPSNSSSPTTTTEAQPNNLSRTPPTTPQPSHPPSPRVSLSELNSMSLAGGSGTRRGVGVEQKKKKKKDRMKRQEEYCSGEEREG